MLKNPPAAYHGLPATPVEEKINDVALPIGILLTHLCVMGFHDL
jgi:hypothetical protein